MKPLALLIAASAPLVAAEPSLTIYNQNFAVVRDSLALDLKAGINEVSFAGATAKLEADSVILRDPAGKAQLQILEQTYRNDPASQQMVLSFFEGKTIDFLRRQTNKPDETIKGKVIRSGFVPGGANVEPVVEVDGKLQFSLPGEPLFPSLGDDSILKPTLAWKLNSAAAAKFDAEIAYVTAGMTWQAAYNLVAPEKGDLIDFVGWITMKNDSGTSFNNAQIKLMAGNVNKVVEAAVPGIDPLAGGAMALAAAPVVTEKAFDEFHLYTLARPATLRDKQTNQVEFVRATGVKAERIYVYDGAAIDGWRIGMNVGADPGYGTESNKKVNVYREFKNSLANHLGIPLPKGRVRFYQQDEADAARGASRSLEFVGENNIDHTPKDELVRLYISDSFDLAGERKRVDFKTSNGNHWAEEVFEIKVRNHKTEPVEVRVLEHLYRWNNWEIKEKSQDFEKKDAQSIEFRVALKPDEEKTLTYRVHYSW